MAQRGEFEVSPTSRLGPEAPASSNSMASPSPFSRAQWVIPNFKQLSVKQVSESFVAAGHRWCVGRP